MPPAVLAEHQVALAETNVFRFHDLVGQTILKNAVLVDTCLMSESVFADNRLVALHVDAGNLCHQPAGRIETLGLDSSRDIEVVVACPNGHDQLFQRAITGALAYSIDGAFDLARALAHRREAVGNGEAQIVVTMDA